MLLGVLLIGGCAGRQQRRAAKAMQNDATLQLCLFERHIDSQPIIDCIRTAPEYEGSLAACGPKNPEEFHDYKECVLLEQARLQQSTHRTRCHSFFGSGFGSTTCTTS
jgi:hypothetical protein